MVKTPTFQSNATLRNIFFTIGSCSSKLRRSRAAVEPLLEEALEELRYLQEVDLSLQELESFRGEDDLRVLEEVTFLVISGSGIIKCQLL